MSDLLTESIIRDTHKQAIERYIWEAIGYLRDNKPVAAYEQLRKALTYVNENLR